MDDPKVIQQGTPGRDTRLSSDGDTGSSADNLPETLTREQAQKLLSDGNAKLGRELKAVRAEAESYKAAYSKLEGELNDTRTKLSDIQRRIDETEEEEARSSPDSLRLYQKEKQLRELEANLTDSKRKLDAEKQSHAAELSLAAESKIEMAIISAAVQHHLDIDRLKEKCQRLKLTTSEQISEMAETMSGQGQIDGDGKRKIPRGDSGMNIGGGSLSGLSPKERLQLADRQLRSK